MIFIAHVCFQAKLEVSILLGRMPFFMGYHPTLSTRMSSFHETITFTKEEYASSSTLGSFQ